MNRLKFTLSENAISFATDALQNAITAETAPIRWKFAIFSLVQSIELSLKELLFRQHPFLIYKDVDKPKLTVGIDQATSRLRQISGINLSADESAALKTAQEVRNQIVHHQADESIPELKLVFARLLGFLNDFHQSHLDESLREQIDPKLWQAGAIIQEYGRELFSRASLQMKADGIESDHVIACPKCGWNSLCAYEPNEETCYVCGHMEHLVVCYRCSKVMFFGDHHENGKRPYCWECLCYVTDDHWYEQSVGK